MRIIGHIDIDASLRSFKTHGFEYFPTWEEPGCFPPDPSFASMSINRFAYLNHEIKRL